MMHYDAREVAHIAATLLIGKNIEPHTIAGAVRSASALLDEAYVQEIERAAREAAAEIEAAEAAEAAAAEQGQGAKAPPQE